MYTDLSMLYPRFTRSIATITATGFTSVSPVFAHSAEQGFILLLPTNTYIAAGTLAVVASILLISVLGHKIPNWMLRSTTINAPTVAPIPAISLVSTFIVFSLIWIGFTGPRDPLGNLLPLTIWHLWWIGFVAAIPIFGNLWAHVNPWTGLYLIFIQTENPPLHFPNRLNIWPGVLVFVVFHIFAIADIAPSDPYRLAIIVGGYWVFTFAGMLLFGGSTWLKHAECFSIMFELIRGLAPLQSPRIGIPGWAILRLHNVNLSQAAFCIVMLGAGSFDGLHETFWWLAKININPLEFPGRSAVVMTSTLGLIATCFALGLTFTTSVFIGNWIAGDPNVSVAKALAPFALSLIPIAFGYHIAHYLTSFLVGIQYSAVALSDPFATGANLFGMAKIQVTTGFLNDPGTVKLIWFTQAFVVVLSHIIAVAMAHTAAENLYTSYRQSLLAQSALSVLMIAYTIFGLWLLASPRGV